MLIGVLPGPPWDWSRDRWIDDRRPAHYTAEEESGQHWQYLTPQHNFLLIVWLYFVPITRCSLPLRPRSLAPGAPHLRPRQFPPWEVKRHGRRRLTLMETLRHRPPHIFCPPLPSGQILAALPSDTRNDVAHSYRTAYADMAHRLSSSRISANKTAWRQWRKFTD